MDRTLASRAPSILRPQDRDLTEVHIERITAASEVTPSSGSAVSRFKRAVITGGEIDARALRVTIVVAWLVSPFVPVAVTVNALLPK